MEKFTLQLPINNKVIVMYEFVWKEENLKMHIEYFTSLNWELLGHELENT